MTSIQEVKKTESKKSSLKKSINFNRNSNLNTKPIFDNGRKSNRSIDQNASSAFKTKKGSSKRRVISLVTSDPPHKVSKSPKMSQCKNKLVFNKESEFRKPSPNMPNTCSASKDISDFERFSSKLVGFYPSRKNETHKNVIPNSKDYTTKDTDLVDE